MYRSQNWIKGHLIKSIQNLVKLLKVSAVTNHTSCIEIESKCNRSLICIAQNVRHWVNTVQRFLHFINQFLLKHFIFQFDYEQASAKNKIWSNEFFFYMIVLYTENAKDPKKFKIFHCQIYLVLFKCTLSYLQLYPLA